MSVVVTCVTCVPTPAKGVYQKVLAAIGLPWAPIPFLAGKGNNGNAGSGNGES